MHLCLPSPLSSSSRRTCTFFIENRASTKLGKVALAREVQHGEFADDKPPLFIDAKKSISFSVATTGLLTASCSGAVEYVTAERDATVRIEWDLHTIHSPQFNAVVKENVKSNWIIVDIHVRRVNASSFEASLTVIDRRTEHIVQASKMLVPVVAVVDSAHKELIHDLRVLLPGPQVASSADAFSLRRMLNRYLKIEDLKVIFFGDITNFKLLVENIRKLRASDGTTAPMPTFALFTNATALTRLIEFSAENPHTSDLISMIRKYPAVIVDEWLVEMSSKAVASAEQARQSTLFDKLLIGDATASADYSALITVRIDDVHIPLPTSPLRALALQSLPPPEFISSILSHPADGLIEVVAYLGDRGPIVLGQGRAVRLVLSPSVARPLHLLLDEERLVVRNTPTHVTLSYSSQLAFVAAPTTSVSCESHCRLSGWLQKRSALSRWQLRYAVVNNGVLAYYHTRHAMMPAGVIDLKSAIISLGVTSEEFVIRTKSRTYTFLCSYTGGNASVWLKECTSESLTAKGMQMEADFDWTNLVTLDDDDDDPNETIKSENL